MAVYRFNPLADARWPELLQRHSRASIFHTPGWLEALRRTYGYEPVVYTTCAPGQDLSNGILFCQIKSRLTGRRLVSVPFSDYCQPLCDRDQDLEEILQELERSLAKENWKYLELRPVAVAAGIMASAWSFRKSHEFLLHRLDLTQELDQIFSRFHDSNVKRKIRRAEREKVTYQEGTSAAHLSAFYQLFLLTRRKHQIPPQPMHWFSNLIACLGDAIKIRLAVHQETPIAAIVTVSYRKTYYYKYGASNQAFGNLGGNPLLFWHTIQEAKQQGACLLDFGRSDLDNPGLIEFKDRWGASRSQLAYYRYPLPGDSATAEGWKMKMAKRVFNRLPDRMLVYAGNVLYRHMG